MTHRSLALWLTLAFGAIATGAWAGPWQARDAAGVEWELKQDTEGDEGYLVERRTADRRADGRFGIEGRAAVKLGPDDDVPGAMRVDAKGRIWVAGSSQDVGDARPSVLRLMPGGQPDTTWGRTGRVTAGPEGGELWAYDLLPLPDGSALVTGDMQNDDGDDRLIVWRLAPDGSIDPAFGSRGVWQRPGTDSAHAVSMAEGPAGVYAVAAVAMQGAEPWIEVYATRAGDTQFALATRERVAPDATGEYHLLWENSRWQVRPGRGTVQLPFAVALATTAAPSPVAAPTNESGGHAAIIPFGDAAAPARAPGPAEEDNSYLWAALVGALVAGVGWLALRRRSAADIR